MTTELDLAKSKTYADFKSFLTDSLKENEPTPNPELRVAELITGLGATFQNKQITSTLAGVEKKSSPNMGLKVLESPFKDLLIHFDNETPIVILDGGATRGKDKFKLVPLESLKGRAIYHQGERINTLNRVGFQSEDADNSGILIFASTYPDDFRWSGQTMGNMGVTRKITHLTLEEIILQDEKLCKAWTADVLKTNLRRLISQR